MAPAKSTLFHLQVNAGGQSRAVLDGNKHIFRCQRAGQAKCMLGCEIKSDGRADATTSSYSAQAVSHLLFQGGCVCSPKRDVFLLHFVLGWGAKRQDHPASLDPDGGYICALFTLSFSS